jgi:ABC-type antimicrobial peptide transport system permease subunit
MRSDTAPCTTVVGIAEDVMQREIATTQRYHYYVLLDQNTRTWGNWMALRLRGDAVREVEHVREVLQRVMPGASFVTVHPLRRIVNNAQRSWRMGATMFVAFGVLALVVAAVGLYGVIGYNVEQRMHELGVRIAVGAQPRDILRLVVGQSVSFALAGTAFGLLVAAAASRWIQPLLFQQSARDPFVYGGVGATMIAVALAASALPALRASRTDPTTALRAD